MRNLLTGLSVFATAFAIGVLLAFELLSYSKPNTITDQITFAVLPPALDEDLSHALDSAPPNAAELEWLENNDPKFKIRMLELGEGFHGDQVNAKSGETWIGLFRKNDHYYLETTKIRISASHDDAYDGEDELNQTGKTVSTTTGLPAVFLLRHAEEISDGEIKTLFYVDPYDADQYSESDYEIWNLRNGSMRKFDFNGSHYELRVENRSSREEYLEKGSKLVLEKDGKEQVLRYLADNCSDCTWSLNWVGDLDRDGKLDFYFDLSDHYNISDRRLFLSSEAKQGEFLKFVARFWTNGC